MSEPQSTIDRPSTENEARLQFPHLFLEPHIDPSAFIAAGAQILGDVHIGAESSIWYNCVIRGDVNKIRIGARTNIQDLSLLHVTDGGDPTIVGDGVTVGHSVILHACTIGNHSLIGMGSVVLDGAEIGELVLLGAGSLVTSRTKIPPRTKAFGRPAKVVAELTDEEIRSLEESAVQYVALARVYRK
jgi:carbonic anhydrase/acetyltransferase-like protein (isoleucine patch superfamily)